MNTERPLWVRGSDAARRLGISIAMLERGVQLGQLPLRITYLGERQLPYVATADLENYLSAWSFPPRTAGHPAGVIC